MNDYYHPQEKEIKLTYDRLAEGEKTKAQITVIYERSRQEKIEKNHNNTGQAQMRKQLNPNHNRKGSPVKKKII